MNLSQNISLLKQIDTKLNDNVYLGITESQAILSTMDTSIDNIEIDINNMNSLLTTLSFSK